jgi:hypothetical protein
MTVLKAEPRAFVAAMLEKSATWEEIAKIFTKDGKPITAEKMKQWYEFR